MQMASWSSRMLLAAIGLVAMATLAPPQTTPPNSTPAIPKGKETDVKFYSPNGGKPVIGGRRLRADAEVWLDTVVSRQPVLRHGRRYRRVPEATSRHWRRPDHAAARPAPAGNQGRWLDLCR